ncbi:MAG: CbiQ family ECF transporter T component [Bacillota bacterium]|nr:CbiQ family ECF transporter T component [Bacillota bacterium]
MIHVDAIAYQSKYNHVFTGTRITMTLIVLVVSILVDFWVLYFVNLAVAFAMIFSLTRIRVITLVKLMMVPVVFTGITALMIAFDITQSMSSERMLFALSVFLRSVSSFALMFSLSLTIPMNRIIDWMVMLRMPSAFVQLFGLSYRMLFVIIEESLDMILSQQLRYGFIKPKTAFLSVVQMSSMLFMRVLSRMDEMESAMRIRFYHDIRS